MVQTGKFGRDLPLIFHDNELGVIYSGAYDRPFYSSVAELTIGSHNETRVVQAGGSELGHIALFASYIAHKEQTPVTFDFNDVELRIEGDEATAESPLELSDDESTAIERCFANVAMQEVLNRDQMMKIGARALKLMSYYDEKIAKPSTLGR